MAEPTTMKAERQAVKDEFGTRNFKKAAKVAALQTARDSRALLEKAGDPVWRGKKKEERAKLAPPEVGPTQTIDVSSGLGGNMAATQEAARASGAGAQSAASQAAAAVRARAHQDISDQYGQGAQDAARARSTAGLDRAGEATFAEKLGQQAVQGAVQGAVDMATLGAGNLAGIPEGVLAAAQSPGALYAGG